MFFEKNLFISYTILIAQTLRISAEQGSLSWNVPDSERATILANLHQRFGLSYDHIGSTLKAVTCVDMCCVEFLSEHFEGVHFQVGFDRICHSWLLFLYINVFCFGYVNASDKPRYQSLRWQSYSNPLQYGKSSKKWSKGICSGCCSGQSLSIFWLCFDLFDDFWLKNVAKNDRG